MLFGGVGDEHATPLYSRWIYSPLLVLDLGLDVVNGIRGLDLESDGLAGKGLHENLHAARRWVNNEAWYKNIEEAYMKVGWKE